MTLPEMVDLVKTGIEIGLVWIILTWVFGAAFILSSRISQDLGEQDK